MVDPTPAPDSGAGSDMNVDATPDEDLPQSHRREHPRLRRASRPLLVLLVLGAVVAAVLTIRSEAGNDPNAAVTRTVSSSPSVSPSRSASQSPTRAGGPAPGDAAACPSGGRCRTSAAVPASVLTAVRGVFPNVRRRYASTVLLTQDSRDAQLHFRQLNAAGRGARVFVQVRRPTGDDTIRSFADDDGHARHIFVQIRSHGFIVEVYVSQTQTFGPQADETGLRTVQRLAADRRLLATH